MKFNQIFIAFFFFASVALTICSASDANIEADTVIDDSIETTARSFYKTFYCFSNHYNYNHCDVGKPINKFKLVKQISKKPCVAGSTYFQKKTGVAVTEGCKAKFAYTVKEPIRKKITCTSLHYKKQVCYVSGKIKDLYIHKILKNPCKLGYSYYKGYNSITVDHGCSAIFSYTLYH